MAEYKKLDNEDILKAVDVNIRQAVGTFDSKLSLERTRVMDHYTGKLPFLIMMEIQIYFSRRF